MAITPEEADERRLATGLDRARLAALDWAEKADAAQLRAEQHLAYIDEHRGKPFLGDVVARERRLADGATAQAEQRRGLAEMWARVASVIPPPDAAPVVTVSTTAGSDPVAIAQEVERMVRRHGRGQ